MRSYSRRNPYIKSDEFLKFLKNNSLKLLDKKSNKKDYIFIKSKNGIHEVRVCSLRKGGVPTIATAVDKNKYFEIQARKIHGDTYNYEKVNYKTNKIKIEIICPFHGSFYQYPYIHLKGQGCSKCGWKLVSKARREGICGWGLSDWIKLAEKSKDFDSFKLYIIEIIDDEEHFIKIGRTFKKLNKRFKQKRSLPYKYKVINIQEANAEYIFNLERKLKNKLKEYKYIPQKKFNGMYECFNIEAKTLLTSVPR